MQHVPLTLTPHQVPLCVPGTIIHVYAGSTQPLYGVACPADAVSNSVSVVQRVLQPSVRLSSEQAPRWSCHSPLVRGPRDIFGTQETKGSDEATACKNKVCGGGSRHRFHWQHHGFEPHGGAQVIPRQVVPFSSSALWQRSTLLPHYLTSWTCSVQALPLLRPCSAEEQWTETKKVLCRYKKRLATLRALQMKAPHDDVIVCAITTVQNTFYKLCFPRSPSRGRAVGCYRSQNVIIERRFYVTR